MKGERLPQTVLAQLSGLGCVQNGDTVCCALSGGADSVCLLRCLLACRDELGISVTAVHVNHNLRGAESRGDQAFCEQLCRTLGVPLQVISVDAAARAEADRCSEELAARECRYAAFETIGADWIATAHTASDNLETLVHRLVRGASLHGLGAIPPKNGRFLRPLLCITRGQVETYLHALGQAYVTDSTNLTDAYTRNRIRHTVIPTLKQLNPSVERTASYTMRSLRREDDYLQQQAQAAFAACYRERGKRLEQLDTLHPALQIRCIAMLLETQRLSYDAPLLERLLGLAQNGGRWNLSRRVYAVAKSGMLWIETVPPPVQPLQGCVLLQLGENRIFPGFVLSARIIEPENCVKNGNVHEKFANDCLDYDRIKGSIFLRTRQPGERIRLPGRGFSSSLKKVIQGNVPQKRRKTLHILADDAGVVFVEMLGADERVLPNADTKRLLRIEVTEESEDAYME